MPVSVDVKRAAFRQLYSSAVTQANTSLLGALTAAIAPSLSATLAGKQVIEAQADGVVTKYQLPPGLSGQSQDVASMWGQLQDLYDRAVAPTSDVPAGGGLTGETTNLPSAQGLAIFNWMMGQLKVVRAYMADHSQACR